VTTSKTLTEEEAPAEDPAEAAAAAPTKDKKERHTKRSETISSHSSKIIEQVDPDIETSNGAILVMNAFLSDIFESFATEGARLVDINRRNSCSSFPETLLSARSLSAARQSPNPTPSAYYVTCRPIGHWPFDARPSHTAREGNQRGIIVAAPIDASPNLQKVRVRCTWMCSKCGLIASISIFLIAVPSWISQRKGVVAVHQ
jgi:hypothetical protein